MKKSRQTPIEQRRGQIEKEIEKVQKLIQMKTVRDFKTEDAFGDWQQRQANKIFELNEELIILERPEEYNEIPLAVAAEELGITLNEILEVVKIGLIELSAEGLFAASARITRDELGRAIEVGAEELLRVATQEEEEVFADGLEFLRAGDVAAAERCLDRIYGFRGYSKPYDICYELGVELISGRFDEVVSSLGYIGKQEIGEVAAIIPALKAVIESVPVTDKVTAIFVERILAFVDGKKQKPFDRTFYTYEATECFSTMNENQRHAMFISNVVFEAIRKYKFTKEMEKISGWRSEVKREEFERVIRNAVYTALEAEATYHESP
ncbi:MAG: hypothetical protein IPL32_03660 [Chloracidobacterium sp.]|nr:hypothetical protein [Chloracidobacterium sp.]